MATNDKQRQFDEIVAQLTEQYPSLKGRRRWSRQTLVITAVLSGLCWGLLSVAMVAWGTAGLMLTGAVVAVVAAGAVADAVRRR